MPLEFGTASCARASSLATALNVAKLTPRRKVRRPILELFIVTNQIAGSGPLVLLWGQAVKNIKTKRTAPVVAIYNTKALRASPRSILLRFAAERTVNLACY